MPHGNASLPAVLDLASHGAAAGLVEQRARERSHQQRRHQVLEHRGAPRQQRGHALDAHDQPTEMKPMPLRHVALGDGDEAGQARLGCQQVVVRAIEPPRAVRIGAVDSRSRTGDASGRRESRSASRRRWRDSGRPVGREVYPAGAGVRSARESMQRRTQMPEPSTTAAGVLRS